MKKWIKKISPIFAGLFSCLFLFACSISVGGNPIPLPPTLPGWPGNNNESTSISEMFSQYRVVTRGQNVTVRDDISGQTQTFNYLLDRQLSLLTEDLIYRLTAVYGPGAVVTGAGAGYGFDGVPNSVANRFSEVSNPDISGVGTAMVQNHSLIDMPVRFMGGAGNNPQYARSNGVLVNAPLSVISIDEIASFALMFQNGLHLTDLHPLFWTIRLQNAIVGGYSWNSGFEEWDNILNPSDAWQFPFSSGAGFTILPAHDAQTVFTNFFNAQYEPLKLALANILISGSYNDFNSITNYQQALSQIDRLGFVEQDKTNITNFILNHVIGSDIVARDNYHRQYIVAPNNTLTGDPSDFSNPLGRRYKAYELLIPAMVERALANSFSVDHNGNTLTEMPIFVLSPFGDLVLGNDGRVTRRDIMDYTAIMQTRLNPSDSRPLGSQEFGGDIIRFYSFFPRMTRSQSNIIPIEDLPSFTPGNGTPPDIIMQPFFAQEIQSIILQPSDDNVALAALILLINTDVNINIEFSVRARYVANGVEWLNDIVSSTTAGGFVPPRPGASAPLPTTNFVIEGEFDFSLPPIPRPGQEPMQPFLPYAIDLNIAPHMPRESNESNARWVGRDLATGATVFSNTFPTMSTYDGTDENFSLFQNNPFQISGFEAGNNFVELILEVHSVQRRVGGASGELVPYDGPPRFRVGFMDPLF